MQEYQTRGTIDLRAFWIRRLLRLVPALLVILLVLLVLGLLVDGRVLDHGQGISTPPEQNPNSRQISMPYWPGIMVVLLPISNFGILGYQEFRPMLVAWSLAVEDQFYLVWPLVLLFLTIRCRAVKTVALTVSLGVPVFLAWRLFLIHRGAETGIVPNPALPWIYYRTDCRADHLLTGCALGLALAVGWVPSTKIAKRIVAGLAWAGALVILTLFVVAEQNYPWVYSVGFTMTALATAVVVLHIIIEPDASMGRALSWPVLVGIGQLSYGIYLWHWALMTYTPGDSLTQSAAVVVLTAIGTMLSWRFVEQPALRLKRRFERRADFPPAAMPSGLHQFHPAGPCYRVETSCRCRELLPWRWDSLRCC
ncbi:MAG: acyltransferase [Chloroflexota bacterium]|nr:acyltransferase [Chloroflexota bacterium]